jgi:hypothetical protein
MRIGGGFFQGRDGHSPCNVLSITTQTNSSIREHKVQKKVRWNIPECLQDCSHCFNLNSVVEFKESNLKPLQGIDKKRIYKHCGPRFASSPRKPSHRCKSTANS